MRRLSPVRQYLKIMSSLPEVRAEVPTSGGEDDFLCERWDVFLWIEIHECFEIRHTGRDV